MNTNLRTSVMALALLCGATAFAYRERTFYEGFEGRTEFAANEKDFASNVWLPEGWTEFSKIEGHKNYPDIPGGTDPTGPEEWDYTWCTKPSSGLYGITPFGGAYAHVMTHNWSVGQDQTPKQSDEWLVTPTIKVQAGDVLSFATCFNPYLTIRPDGNLNPTEKTNVLEVRISTDGGENWSEPLWDSYTESCKMTIDEIMGSIVTYNWVNDFRMYFVDLDAYYGKDVKIAFRYYGKNGADLSLDEVAVGVPQPEASYELPDSYLWPMLTEKVDLPDQPLAYAPAGQEHTWVNTSLYAKKFDWTYGESGKADTRDLKTPAYEDGTTVPFPTLNSSYGENETGAWSLVNKPSAYTQQIATSEPMIQYGGTIGRTLNADGTECRGGVGTVNLYDPDLTGVRHQSDIAISSMAEMMLDNRFTTGSVRSWDFLQGVGNIFPNPAKPYGVDYFYASVLLNNIEPDSKLCATIYPWETETVSGQEVSYAGDPIATAPVSYDPESVGSGIPTTIMFVFSETPVTVDKPYIILISGFKRGEIGDSGREEIMDDIRFLYAQSTSKKFMGSSVAAFKEYDTYVAEPYAAYAYFSTFSSSVPDRHVAGLLMGVGITNSTMTLEGGDNVIEADPEGCSKDFTVKASTDPRTWRLVEGMKACEWASFTTKETSDGTYQVTITVNPNDTEAYREKTIRLASSGSYVDFLVKQDKNTSGIDNVATGEAPVEYYNLQGIRITDPQNGVFIKRQGNKVEKIVK